MAATAGLWALVWTRTAVPQALQNAACSSSGISHWAQNSSSPSSPTPLVRADRSSAASISPTCSTLRIRRIRMPRMSRPQRMLRMTPRVALPTNANR